MLTGVPPAAPSVSAPTFPANSFIATQGLEATYHVNVTLGGHAQSNGGDGVSSKVLFDTGGKSLPLYKHSQISEVGYSI